MYEGKLNVAELMEWINSLNKYFDFEEIEDKNNVRYAVTRLKGHASTQNEEVRPKSLINTLFNKKSVKCIHLKLQYHDK